MADTVAPALTDFDFTPSTVDVFTGEKQVTVTARVTDATGAEAPTMILASESTSQQLGFGTMTRTSGDTKDGTYSRTVTIPTTAAPGDWRVSIYPLRDTIGNSQTGFNNHPTKLKVTNGPADTAAPVLADFDFTPTTVDVSTGEKQVTVTARVTDATGAEAPTMILASESTSQQLGFGTMTRTSGDTKDGTYSRTVTIPTTAAPGDWRVSIYPLRDTIGNSQTGFNNHPTKLKVTNGATAPAAPTKVSAVHGDQSAQVSWTASANNGGSAVTEYTITSTPGGITKTVAGDQTTATITGLTNGTAYTFTVAATNGMGNGPASEPSNEVTPVAPATVPSAPTNVTAAGGNASATISWTKPTANGSPITGYTVTSTPGGVIKTVTGADTTSITIGGLTNGTTYTFTVTATNAIGDSATSHRSNEVTPAASATVPDRVDKPQAKVKNRKVIIRWKPVGSNGSDLTGYTVASNRGHLKTVAPGKTKVVFRKLKPGRYKFKVTATNEFGDSRSSRKVRVDIR
ncbi:fibronectin type III domain-containing protein [Nocardioides sp. OK12]|uniref:fibronectin type III domain-containing protein n=1 Tax=Nocardioides sp. OK12 TaxID=2758661 RepID=UPI0021C3B850|nr:fibronectin type III domain-containing protein [Nocardioides sp. OK12]